MKYYTIGEIFRQGLLKNSFGEPYKHKGAVSKALSGVEFKAVRTAWGVGKTYSEKQIEGLNKERIIEVLR